MGERETSYERESAEERTVSDDSRTEEELTGGFSYPFSLAH